VTVASATSSTTGRRTTSSTTGARPPRPPGARPPRPPGARPPRPPARPPRPPGATSSTTGRATSRRFLSAQAAESRSEQQTNLWCVRGLHPRAGGAAQLGLPLVVVAALVAAGWLGLWQYHGGRNAAQPRPRPDGGRADPLGRRDRSRRRVPGAVRRTARGGVGYLHGKTFWISGRRQRARKATGSWTPYASATPCCPWSAAGRRRAQRTSEGSQPSGQRRPRRLAPAVRGSRLPR
jgi:hypothetical protein